MQNEITQAELDSVLTDELAACLATAAVDEQERPAFYDMLLQSNVFVLTQDEIEVQHNSVSTSNANPENHRALDLIHWQMQDGHYVIPFFSSLEKLKAAMTQHMTAQSIDTLTDDVASTQKFITLHTATLFEYTQGQTLFLNPNSDYSKLFYPDEVKSLLDPAAEKRDLSIVTAVTGALVLSVIEKLPQEVIAAAEGELKKSKPVIKAYLARFESKMENETGYLLAIEFNQFTSEAEIENVCISIGDAVSQQLGEADILDICPIQLQGCEVSQFFLQHVTPFYQRRLGGFLRHAIPVQQK